MTSNSPAQGSISIVFLTLFTKVIATPAEMLLHPFGQLFLARGIRLLSDFFFTSFNFCFALGNYFTPILFHKSSILNRCKLSKFLGVVDPAGETSNQLFDTFADWENYLKQHRINVLELKL